MAPQKIIAQTAHLLTRCPKIALPLVGLGTWKLTGNFCTEIVQKALEMGYTHIDTATGYDNHKDIGKALSNFSREKIVITSKINSGDLLHNSIREVYTQMCTDLQVSYIDLVLLHTEGVPLSTLYDLQELIQENKLRALGVSNFKLTTLKRVVEDMGIPVTVNQIEIHVPLQEKEYKNYFKSEQAQLDYLASMHELPEMINYCRENNIALVAHRPLAKGLLVRDERLIELGKNYNKTAAQVALRWLVEQDICVIPKADTDQQLKENLELFDFALTDLNKQLLA